MEWQQANIFETYRANEGSLFFMPSYGAERKFARERSSEKQLKRMTIDMPEAEGRKDYIAVQHDYAATHKSENFRFEPHDSENLAAHLSKHLGVKLPGKAAGSEPESEKSKSDFE